MAVKIAVGFTNTDSDGQLVQRTKGVLVALLNNLAFPNPTPSLAVISTSLDTFITSMGAAVGGGVALTAAKNAARAELVALLRQLGSYLQITCGGDMAKLLTSSFPVQKEKPTPVGVLPAPSNLTVDFGPLTGQLVGKVSPVSGAVLYNWQITTLAAPTVILQTQQTTAASATFSDLTRGTEYSIMANAVGSAGPSDWSDPVSNIVV